MYKTKFINTIRYSFATRCFFFLGVTLSFITESIAQTDYKIYSTEQQREIRLSKLVDAVAETDVLFFGEEHNDSIAHFLQDTLYKMLLNRYGTVTLSLEMFETDNQLVLNEYLADHITEDKMIKDARAWKNYATDYRSLVETAKVQNQTVVAANAPRRYINLVSRRGLVALTELPKASRQYLPPLPIFTADADYRQRFAEIMGMTHGGEVDDNFFHAQCAWDATMSYKIFQQWRKNKREKILHLNGRFHTDYQQGTMRQLLRYKKKIKAKNISCSRTENYSNPDWTKYAALGDFVIISPQN